MTPQNNLEVKGSILDHPLAEILAEIAQSGLNGSLKLSHGEQKIVIYFDGGDAIFAVSNSRQDRLFHIVLREEKILPSELKKIPNFINDIELKINLIKAGILTDKEINEFFAIQVRQIVLDALEWHEGSWIFSPLVRLKSDIRVPLDLADMLFLYGRKIPAEKAVRRFVNLEEQFGIRREVPDHIDLLPSEAFVFSRFERGSKQSVKDLKIVGGLAEAETLKTLYSLWLGGFLVRQRWRSAFSPEDLSAILSAKFELKSKAFVPIAAVPAKVADTKKAFAEQTVEKIVDVKPDIALEEYLERLDNALTYYEILDIPLEAAAPEIKSAYFGLAKRFHPDLFYHRVEDNLHRRIQNAFTELAQAYETLRKTETREVYDFRLRKELANLAKQTQTAQSAPQSTSQKLETQAAENFKSGFDLVMEDKYDEAVAYLARAVHLAGGTARYHAYYGKALSANRETYRQAEAEFQAALRLEPDNLDYRLMLAKLFIKIGFNKRAEGELRRILEKTPNNYEVRSLLDSLLNK